MKFDLAEELILNSYNYQIIPDAGISTAGSSAVKRFGFCLYEIRKDGKNKYEMKCLFPNQDVKKLKETKIYSSIKMNKLERIGHFERSVQFSSFWPDSLKENTWWL